MTNASLAPDNEIFREAIELAFELAIDEGELAWAHLIRGMANQYAGQIAGCVTDFREAERLFWSADPPHLREGGAVRCVIFFGCIGEGVDLPFAQTHCESWIAEAASRNDVFSGNFIKLASTWLLLSQGDSDGALARINGVSDSWDDVDDDMFWSTSRSYRIGVELYRDPGRAFGLVSEIEPELRKRYVSMVPIHRSTFHTMRGHAAAAAYVNGSGTEAETRARIQESIAMLAMGNYWAPTIDGLRGHLAWLDGDKRASAAHFGRAAEGWEKNTQWVFAHSARLRQAEVGGDQAAAESSRAALRFLGVADPERYSVLFAGPSLA